MIRTDFNIGDELKKWFEKSIIPFSIINFNDDTTFDIVLEIFIYDYMRYYQNAVNLIELNKIILRHELVGIFLYRISRNYFLKNNEEIAQLYSLLGRFISGFEIYYSADIGRSLKINHGLGTVIGARTVIGENALIHQGVTFGERNGKRPVVKNNVTIYAGAKILGGIIIGNNVIVGANSVCINDVEDNKTVAGVPAKILNK
jgi:serine O-acetyltransferase